jgi:hypothetical protein
MSSDDEIRQLRAQIWAVGQALDGVLASRWLRVLEHLEAPVRSVRPGLGTVRARLEAIRRSCRTERPFV